MGRMPGIRREKGTRDGHVSDHHSALDTPPTVSLVKKMRHSPHGDWHDVPSTVIRQEVE